VLKSGFNVYGVATDSWHKATLRFSDRTLRIRAPAMTAKCFITLQFFTLKKGIAFQSLYSVAVHDQNAQVPCPHYSKRIAGMN